MELEVVDAEEQALRDLAVQTDRAEGRPAQSEGAKQPEPPAPPAEAPETPKVPEKQTPDSSEPEPEPSPPDVAAKERDEKGRFKAGEPPEAQPPPVDGQKAPVEAEGKPKSQYALAREREEKEAQRKARSWSEIVAEKERIRAEREQWQEERRRAELEAQAQTRPLVKDGIDFEGYQRAYRDFRAKAIQTDDPEAWKNALFSHETLVELDFQAKQEQERVQASSFELNWLKKRDAAFDRDPELENPEAPLRQALERVMQRAPVLYYMPNGEGFDVAMESAQMLLAIGAESELRDQLERALAENEQLRKGSQPARGGPGKPPRGPKSEDDMSIEELEAHYAELSRLADMGR